MTYVMSDLHGCYDAYMRMLKQIHFDPQKDKLFILGDVIDRGPDGIKLLNEIMNSEGIQMLLGNHEYMMLQWLWGLGGKSNWLNRNGGYPTYETWQKCSHETRLKIKGYLENLYAAVAYDDYIMAHGFLGPRITEVEDIVWSRPPESLIGPFENKTLIVGHTPVQFLTPDANSILHRPGLICIDCGSVCVGNGQIGCLRLEDMAEFYEKP